MGICRLFGLPVSKDRQPVLEDVFRLYAKDRSQTFRDDTGRFRGIALLATINTVSDVITT